MLGCMMCTIRVIRQRYLSTFRKLSIRIRTIQLVPATYTSFSLSQLHRRQMSKINRVFRFVYTLRLSMGIHTAEKSKVMRAHIAYTWCCDV